MIELCHHFQKCTNNSHSLSVDLREDMADLKSLNPEYLMDRDNGERLGSQVETVSYKEIPCFAGHDF